MTTLSHSASGPYLPVSAVSCVCECLCVCVYVCTVHNTACVMMCVSLPQAEQASMNPCKFGVSSPSQTCVPVRSALTFALRCVVCVSSQCMCAHVWYKPRKSTRSLAFSQHCDFSFRNTPTPTTAHRKSLRFVRLVLLVYCSWLTPPPPSSKPATV